jgi:hypothetical protein
MCNTSAQMVERAGRSFSGRGRQDQWPWLLGLQRENVVTCWYGTPIERDEKL